MANIPDRPTLDGIEDRWADQWDADGIYRFDTYRRTRPRSSRSTRRRRPSAARCTWATCSATPTPTSSPATSGCAASRSSTRWAGTTTACRPSAGSRTSTACAATRSEPYDDGFEPPFRGDPPKKHQAVPISRPNFLELCDELVEMDEKVFEALYRRLGLSVDWTQHYATIDERSRRASQRAFLRNVARGEAYSQEAPTLWDIDFRTAVAQAEMEDRERPGAYHKIPFQRADGVGPDRDRHDPSRTPRGVRGTRRPPRRRTIPAATSAPTVIVPLYGQKVEITAHELAQPDKGTGIAMICTFGDTTDVTWWRELQLGMRVIIGRDGRLLADAPADVDPEAYALIAGKYPNQAQRAVVEQLTEQGILIGEPRPLQHPVKFYERGERPLEIVTSRQWYIRNGGRDADLRAALVDRGTQVTFHPDHMRHRYENWVEGLNGDWLISRQRFFGVPVPVWYPLDDVRRTALRRAADARARTSSRSTRRPTCPTATPPTSATSPAASPATPTSSTRGRRRRSRRRSPGTGRRTTGCSTGSSPTTCGRRATTSSAPGCSRRSPAATTSSASPRGSTRRCRAGSSTPTARRCRSRRATSSRRWTCSSSTAPMPCATGRRRVDPASTPRTAKTR